MQKKSIINLYLSNWTQNLSIKEVPSSSDISMPLFSYPLGLTATPMVHQNVNYRLGEPQCRQGIPAVIATGVLF